MNRQDFDLILHPAPQTTGEAVIRRVSVNADPNPLRVVVQEPVLIELKSVTTRLAPHNLRTRRVGKDLHIAVEDGNPDRPDVVVEGFYGDAPSLVIGQAESGAFFEYVPTSAEPQSYIARLVDGASAYQALGGAGQATLLPWWTVAGASSVGFLPILLGGGLLAAAAGGGGDSGGAPQGTPATVSGVTATPSPVNEGSSVTATVTMSSGNGASNVPFSIAGTGITAADTGTLVFSNGVTRNGDGTLNVPAGVTSFTVTIPVAADATTEGSETATISAGGQSAPVTINDTSLTPPATVSTVTATPSPVNEGANVTATVTMSSGNGASNVPFSIAGTGITAADTGTLVFSNGVTRNGDGTLNVPAGVTSFAVTIPVAADTTTEGSETATISAGGQSASVTINDTSLTPSLFSQGDPLIDADPAWKLILPIQIEDPNSPDYGKWYYYLDKDGNNAASINDRVTYAQLAAVFNQDINGNVNPAGQQINDVYRYATINGVKFALPTIGHNGTVPVSGVPIGDGWGVMDGLTYGDMAEIYDQFNTNGVNGTDGMPAGWASGDAYDVRMIGQDYVTRYWAATDGAAAGQQTGIEWRGITTNSADEATGNYHAALQVMTADTRAPSLVSSYPVDGSTNFFATENIELNFSEVVKAGSGSIVLSNGTDTRTIDVNDSTQVSIVGKKLTLNPSSNLQANTTYTLTMASGVVTDIANNPYAGLAAGQLDFAVQNFVSKFKFADVGTAIADFGYKVLGAGIGDKSRASSGTPLTDINGDGINDLLIGADDSSRGSTSYPSTEPDEAGNAYVVYGRQTPSAQRLDTFSTALGYRVSGEFVTPPGTTPPNIRKDYFGRFVISVGDLNADGYGDWISTAFTNRPGNDTTKPERGAAYLIYGSAGQTNLDLSTGLGSVVKLTGTSPNGYSQLQNITATDWDRDGIQDLIFSSAELNASSQPIDRTYFVKGQAFNANAEYDDIATFAVNVPTYYNGGSAFRGKAGDFNGDGLEDYIFAQHAGGEKVYIVYGKDRSANLDVTTMTAADGFVVNLPNTSAQYTRGIGDVNGDGFDDLLIGSYVENSTNLGFPDSYVIFGSQAGAPFNVDLANVGTTVPGFKIRSNTSTPYRIMDNAASVGDLNGDGVPEFIVQYFFSALTAPKYKTYVVYGGQQWTNGDELNIDDVGMSVAGFEIDHTNGNSNDGYPKFQNSGDLNGDGVRDMVFSDQAFGSADDTFAGLTTVVTGGKQFSNVFTHWGTGGVDTLTGTTAAEGMVGGLGNDTMVGNGGADVMYGGQGNDTFVLNQSNVNALAAGITDARLARIDGGTGVDALRLFGGADIDFRNIDLGRLESVEQIDAATDTGANTIDITRDSVIAMVTRGDGIGISGHQLAIQAGAGDAVNLHGGAAAWTAQTAVTVGADTYNVWRAAGTEFEVWVKGGTTSVVI